MTRDVAIAGVGYSEPESFTDFRTSTRSKEEQAYVAIEEALDHANTSIDEVDATMFTTVDGFEATFRVERTMEILGSADNIPVFSINTGGTAGGSGVKAAYEYIASGKYDVCIVYGSPSFDSVLQGQQVMQTASEPLYEQHFVAAIQMGALPSSAYMDTYGATEEDFAKCAAQNYESAALNPYAHRDQVKTAEEILESPIVAWPLRRLMTCPVSSGSAATIMVADDLADRVDTPVWIDAIDSISDTFSTGYRTYEWFDMLNVLAKRVYDEADIEDPRSEVDVAETFNPYIPFELMEYEAMEICGEGEAKHLIREGVTARNGEIPFNPSGGVVSTNSGLCAGLTRHTETALQLMGDAGDRQIEDNPETGICHAWGANLGQFDEMAILSTAR